MRLLKRVRYLTPVIYAATFICLSGMVTGKNLDSLWNVYSNNNNPDTTRIYALNSYIWEIMFSNPDSAKTLSIKNLALSRKSKFQKGRALSYHSLGVSNFYTGQYYEALENYRTSLDIYRALNDTVGVARIYGNIAGVYYDQGNYVVALEYLHKNIAMKEALGDEASLARAYDNAAILQMRIGRFDEAKSLVKKSLEIALLIRDHLEEAECYENLGNIEHEVGNPVEALRWYEKALETKESHSLASREYILLGNMAVVWSQLGETDKALKLQERALKLAEENNDQTRVSNAYTNLGYTYLSIKEYQKAIEVCERGLKIAKEVDVLPKYESACECLYQAYYGVSDYKTAVEYLHLYHKIHDSISSAEVTNQLVRQKLQFEFEQKQRKDSLTNARLQTLKDAEIKAKTSQIRNDKVLKWVLYAGIGVVLMFLFIVFNRFRITRKQNAIIAEQSEKVEEKNKEITDSITYARRIQEAILPSSELISACLPESFVLYLPKDIVAGDFYWIEERNNNVLFAAADCTGHGVPGAMVSVICNNALNRSVREFGLSDPGKILDKTRELVLEQFEKSKMDVKDGMDVALCVFDSSTGVLRYAGAHNPLWIIRNQGLEVEEVKASKQPVGQFEHHKSFLTHEKHLQKGDTLYIFSDGLVDQFGGEKGKKLKNKAFKAKLLEIQKRSMEDQKMELNRFINDWKGAREQLDDICVFGVRI